MTKVCCVGDSITQGMANNVETSTGGYRGTAESIVANFGHPCTFVGGLTDAAGRHHEGHGGWTIADAHSNIADILATFDPTILVLLIGTNDAGSSDPLVQGNIPAHFGHLLDTIREIKPTQRIIVPTIPVRGAGASGAINQATLGLNSALASVCRPRGVRFADAGLTIDDIADGIHPNAAGYSKYANAVAYAILGILASDVILADPISVKVGSVIYTSGPLVLRRAT